MANTDADVVLLVLKRPISIPRSDGNHIPAKYLLCRPDFDRNSPLNALRLLDVGVDVFGIRLCVATDNIDAIFYETTSGSLDSALTNAANDLYGYVDMAP